jgi:4-amino-4-deoxy-L-arabinose transferase-like glycosyltransferase
MKLIKERNILIGVILLAALLRFYKLGTYPSVFNDELAVGYNAWSILKTGRDEFGEKFPVFFRSFGEGKLPLYVYEAVPAVAIFGLTGFACRLMPALLGTLTIWLIYLFVQEALIFGKCKDKKLKKWLPLLSSFFLATMPWHIHFSRGVFGQESLFWCLLGSYLSLKFLNEKKYKYWIWALLSFSAGIMTYHAAKAFVPLWVTWILIHIWKKHSFKKAFSLGVIALVLSGFVWIWMSTSKLGNERAKDMSVFSEHSGVSAKLWRNIIESQGQHPLYTRALHNKVESYGRDIIGRYLSHFDPIFLWFEGDVGRPRYKVPNNGLLLFATLPLIVFGIYKLVEFKLWPVSLFLLLAPIPASLTFETPSSVRGIFMTIPLAIISSLGLLEIIKLCKKVRLKIVVISFSTIVIIWNIYFYLNSYYLHQKFYNSSTWQYGAEEIVNVVTGLAKNYEKVKMTRSIGTPYILFLFFNQYDPATWQVQEKIIEDDHSFSFIHIINWENIEFTEDKCPVPATAEDKVLYVCEAGHERGDLKEVKTFYWADGKPSFILLE